MFSIQGEVISDQFYPLKFIWFWVSLRRYGKKRPVFWEFDPWGGGGSPIPKSKCQNSDKILTFFVKTKNDPYGLKCKINPKIFFRLRGSQKGGGGPPFGKNSQKISFFLDCTPNVRSLALSNQMLWLKIDFWIFWAHFPISTDQIKTLWRDRSNMKSKI